MGVCLQGRALCSVRTLLGGCVLAGSSLPTFPTSMVLKGLFSLSTQGREGGERGRGERKGREGGEEKVDMFTLQFLVFLWHPITTV